MLYIFHHLSIYCVYIVFTGESTSMEASYYADPTVSIHFKNRTSFFWLPIWSRGFHILLHTPCQANLSKILPALKLEIALKMDPCSSCVPPVTVFFFQRCWREPVLAAHTLRSKPFRNLFSQVGKICKYEEQLEVIQGRFTGINRWVEFVAWLLLRATWKLWETVTFWDNKTQMFELSTV